MKEQDFATKAKSSVLILDITGQDCHVTDI